MVKKSKGRNTKALRGAELRDLEKPCSSSENICVSLLGELVEVRHRGAGLRGSWHPARVVKIDADQGLVEYEKLLSRDGSPKFQEYVPLSEDGSRILLRPRPPPFVSPEGWERGLWVEAFYGDAWWEGVLMDDVSETMQVFFPDEGDRRTFCMANLRVSQVWDNKTGAWTMKGKWTEFASKFRVKRTFAVQPQEPVEIKVEGSEDPGDGNLEKSSEEGKRKRSGNESGGESDDENLFHWLQRHKKQRVDEEDEDDEEEAGGVLMNFDGGFSSEASAPAELVNSEGFHSQASAPAEEEEAAGGVLMNSGEAVLMNSDEAAGVVSMNSGGFHSEFSAPAEEEATGGILMNSGEAAGGVLVNLLNSGGSHSEVSAPAAGGILMNSGEAAGGVLMNSMNSGGSHSEVSAPAAGDIPVNSGEAAGGVLMNSMNSGGSHSEVSAPAGGGVSDSLDDETSASFEAAGARVLDQGWAPGEEEAAGEVVSILVDQNSSPAAAAAEFISTEQVDMNSAPVEEAPAGVSIENSAPEEELGVCRVSTTLDDAPDEAAAAAAASGVSTPVDDESSAPAGRVSTTLIDINSAPEEQEEAGGNPMSLDDENSAPAAEDHQNSTPIKEPSPEAKSNVTNDPQLEANAGVEAGSTPSELLCLETLDAAMGDLQELQETVPLLGLQVPEVARNEEALLEDEATPQPKRVELHLKPARSSKPGKKLLVNRSSGEASSSSSRLAFSTALNKTKKLLLDSGWSLRQSLRERFSRSSQELFCVSPEGKPFVSLASACREWIRRNKHRKLAHLQLIARGENPGPCEFLAQAPGELVVHGSFRARRPREEVIDEVNRSKKMKIKGETSEKRKRGRPRARLEANSGTSSRARHEEAHEEEARLSRRLNLFSWLVEMGVLNEESRIEFRRMEGDELLAGVISCEGIVCSCCRKSFSVSGFERHACWGSCSCPEAAFDVRVEDGRSLLDCKLAALRAMKAKESEVLAENEAIEVDENDDTCAVCGNGGQLVCCDHCPSTYHLKCVQLEKVPEGDWFCPRCCCASCGSNLYNPANQADILYCDQCEREYHANCLLGEGMKYNSGDNRFCSRKCLKIFRGLRKLVGKPNEMEGGFTWTLLRYELQPNIVDLEAIAENSTRLALALTLIQECFRPMIDFRTKIDIVTHILFNQRGDEKRLDFRGFYTLVLEREGEMISVASMRIHGAHAAEIPFIGTRAQYRRQGMCRRLINITQQILQALEVQTLVLPAIAEFAETWIGAFGFQRLTPAQGVQLMELNIVTFPGTSILHKPLTWLHCGRKPPPAEERVYLSLLQDDENSDEEEVKKKKKMPPSPEKPEETQDEEEEKKKKKKKKKKPPSPEKPEETQEQLADEPPELPLVPQAKRKSLILSIKKPASKQMDPVDQSPAEAPLNDDELQKSSKPRAAIAKARSNNRVVKSPTWKNRFLKLSEEQQQEQQQEQPAEAPKKPSIKPEASEGARNFSSEEDPEAIKSPTPRTFSRRRSKAERTAKDARIAGPLGSSQAAYLGIPKWPTNKRSRRAKPVMKSHAALAGRRAPRKRS